MSGAGPSRGILSDCEIFANLRLKLYGAVLTCLHVSPQYVPRDVRGVPGPRAGAGGGGALQGGRADRGDQAAEYWGPAQIPRSVPDMHSRYLYSTSETPAAQLVWMEFIPSTYLLPLLFTYLIQLDTFPRHTHIYSKLKQTMCVKILFSSVQNIIDYVGRKHII